MTKIKANICQTGKVKMYYTGEFTSCLPPEQANDRGVSLVLSDWASISAPLSNNISTTPTWPAVAAKISGVKPRRKDYILTTCQPSTI